MLKKTKFLFTTACICICCFYVWIFVKSISTNLPTPQSPPILYSNQCRHDLKRTILTAIENAKHSIFLVMFGLSDKSILRALQDKADDAFNMKVFFDSRHSPTLDLSNKQAYPLTSKGLLHQKILVIDNKYVFIGSANFTKASLSMHDNLIIGLYSPKIAYFLRKKAPFTPAHYKAIVGGQDISLWLLPDQQNYALLDLKNIIHSASKSLFIVMFTFTHPVLLDEIIQAHKKGIKVTVVIDYYSSMGASSHTIDKLEKEGVTVLKSKGPQLLHHKYLVVDDRILICGSANWTKAAFNKNYDCFIILYNLTNDQKKFLNKLNKIIALETSESN
jgi:cardiolipin synthase A/B